MGYELTGLRLEGNLLLSVGEQEELVSVRYHVNFHLRAYSAADTRVFVRSITSAVGVVRVLHAPAFALLGRRVDVHVQCHALVCDDASGLFLEELLLLRKCHCLPVGSVHFEVSQHGVAKEANAGG